MAQFAQAVGAAGSDWEQMAVEDEALRAAAEVVIGRADMQDLTGLGVPTLNVLLLPRGKVRLQTSCISW